MYLPMSRLYTCYKSRHRLKKRSMDSDVIKHRNGILRFIYHNDAQRPFDVVTQW
jgi:hypothetical protein